MPSRTTGSTAGEDLIARDVHDDRAAPFVRSSWSGARELPRGTSAGAPHPAGARAVDVRAAAARPSAERARPAGGGFTPMDPARIVRPADRLAGAAVPKTERFARGQAVSAVIRGLPVQGVLQGFDHAGRAVLQDGHGRRRVAHIDDVVAQGPVLAVRSTLRALPPGAVVQAPPPFVRAMQAALDKHVVGAHRAAEYVSALVARGYEVFVVGGAVRDAVRLLAEDPRAPQADLLDVMHDVDLVTTAPPSVVREVCKAVAPELKGGGVWSPPAVDMFGAVLAGGKKAGLGDSDGVDICSLKSGRVAGNPQVELDLNEKTFHATFTRDLLQDAEARDFCCNALYYDPVNEAVVDPTLHGLQDAMRGRLHLAPSEDILDDKTLTARFWKFRLRGYDADPDTLARVRRHAEHAYDLQDGKSRWELASSLGRAAPKDLTTPRLAQKWLDELRSAMRADGCGDLFDREMTSRMRGFVTNEILKRTRKGAA